VRDRKPGLSGTGGSDAEYQFVALQRANVGVLGCGARPHRTLAQVDGVERRLGGFRIEFEQRALGDHSADRALDIALRYVLTLARLRI
jgi:hypothetical protein